MPHLRHEIAHLVHLLEAVTLVIIADQIFVFLETSEVIIDFFVWTLLVDLCKEVDDVWVPATELRFYIRLNTADMRPEFVCGALVCEEQGPLVI